MMIHQRLKLPNFTPNVTVSADLRSSFRQPYVNLCKLLNIYTSFSPRLCACNLSQGAIKLLVLSFLFLSVLYIQLWPLFFRSNHLYVVAYPQRCRAQKRVPTHAIAASSKAGVPLSS